MTTDMLPGMLPEFADEGTEGAFRLWSLADTKRQAGAVLRVAACVLPLFAINDVRLLGFGFSAAGELGMRAVLIVWATLLLARMKRPIDAVTLHRHLLAWAVALDFQIVISATSRPLDFAPMLMTNQTCLFAIVVFWPLRFVARAVNGLCLAVALVVVLHMTGTISDRLVIPLSISTTFALAAGLPMVRNIERLRREEFARSEREKAQMEQLRIAKEAAESADRAKTRFLVVVSHEVRTPMNGVLGVLQLLEGSRLDAIAQRQVSIARDCAEHLTGLLDSIIDYARLGAAIEAPNPMDFNPRQLVQGVVELMRVRARAQQTVIEMRIVDDVPEMLCADAGRLRQVLVNLLSNAVKFTERGRVDVSLAVRPGKTDHLLLTATVEDTGIGIPESMLERIFEEFTQAEQSISRRYGGAGLGLAICRRVVTMLGGTITAASNAGVGSRFEVVVPVMASQAAAAPSTRPFETRRRLHVLVVDDDPINQIVACGLLAQAGHDATPVGSGDAAVAETTRERFDAVFMDLHMPLMDGFETARRIREHVASDRGERALPIIALTADLIHVQSPGFAELFSGVVAKPIRREALRQVLASIQAVPEMTHRSDRAWLRDVPVDVVYLGEQIEALGGATVGRLVHQFRGVGRRLLSELGDAVDARNIQRTRELAHRLGSSAAALGLLRFGRAAQRMEQAADREQTADFAGLTSALLGEFDHTFEALHDLAREAKLTQRPRHARQLTIASSR